MENDRKRSGTRTKFRGPHVLVVDDVDENRAIYALALHRAGFHVEVAADGVEALERVVELAPHVIVMDLSMPRMDGCEATRRIRASATGHQIYIIAFSGQDDPKSVEAALAAGCDEFLSKPCRLGLLVERVDAACGPRPSERKTAG